MSDPGFSRVAAIVPARNEAARIAATVRALIAIKAIDEVVVVDDASSDATSARAAAAGARVERTSARAGKGGAMRLGVSGTTADVIVFIDGDLGATACVAALLLGPIIDGEADMTIAAPAASAPSGFGLIEALSREGIRRLAGIRLDRPLSGQRALTRAVLGGITIAPRFGVETALTIDVVRAGFRVREVACEIEHARTGRDAAGFLHRARQGFDVAGVLIARAIRPGPRHRPVPMTKPRTTR